LRTETEMHDLVVAKVAAHRRRRTLMASAAGGAAVVLLLVAVAAGAASSGPGEDVNAGEGDPTTTTEAPTTTETEPATTASTTAPETTTTTTAPPETTTTEPPPTTTEPPPTTTETPSSSVPGPSWPPEVVQLSHGGTFWAVYLAVADRFDDPSLEQSEAPAREIGYVNIGTGQLACDHDATTALGLDPEVDWYTTALYFPSEEFARRFVDLYEPEVVGIAQVQTYCMD